MLIRGTPNNKDDYIIVNSDISILLHKNGFMPIYMSIDSDEIYFKKTESLLDFLKYNNIR